MSASASASNADPVSTPLVHSQSATVTEQSKLQKRIQNRLYKRASRSRKRACNKSGSKAGRRRYHVNRWRLDEEQQVTLSQNVSEADNARASNLAISNQHTSNQATRPMTRQDISEQSSTLWFPLPADHLLHLINYNAFRGLRQNKGMVDCLTVQYCAPGPQPEPPTNHAAFPKYSVILPMAPHYSGSLMPTPVQMSINHFSWIDALPCPTMRENLIKREFEFSHADFVKDLVGTLINLDIFFSTGTPMSVNEDDELRMHDHEPFGTETGLIVWGEPYLIDSWEISPRFLGKWAWAVEHCQGLIDSTNYWRRSRGEPSLLLPSASGTN